MPGAVIREVGIKCDGGFVFGRSIADQSDSAPLNESGNENATSEYTSLWRDQIPDHAVQLSWVSASDGREDAQNIDNGTIFHYLL